MQANGIITITTDFGTRDPYIAIMKGSILTVNPDARLVDVTHDIPPHNIINGAFTLTNAFAYFPPGTVHVAVIDPGVGGNQKDIAIRTERYFFVGPDNGTFSIPLSREKVVEIREIVNPPFLADKVSKTFHGRDVYAPCAAQLSMGRDFGGIGPELSSIRHLDYPHPVSNESALVGEIVSIDSFGNLISNISRNRFKSFVGSRPYEIYFASERFDTIEHTYSDMPREALLALFGSSGHLEISMNSGSAANYFMVSRGSRVTVRRV